MFSKARFEISKEKVLESYKNLEKITDIVSYSVKSNPYITNILEENTSSRFLIHHVNEFKYIKNNLKIYFMLHCPDYEELNLIFKKGIINFIIDNSKDLDFFLEYIKKNNKKVNLFLRMRLKEYTVSTGRYFVYGFFSTEINEYIFKLKNNLNISSLGVHFHRKTQNLSEWSIIREITDSLLPETLEAISYLDIGGGIPVDYKNISPSAIESIYKKIIDIKTYFNNLNIKLIIEPGRAIAAPCGKLIATIKNIVSNNLFIDASVYNCSMDTIVTNIKLLVENEDLEEKGKSYVIKGLTPASEDIFRYRVYFKEGNLPKIGDKIFFINAGAYIYSTDLFDLEKPEIIFVD
ncbi:MAG: decarboxylase [Candidatus ainarchaeum sp.]|nr:decarboxylase [Candidatus ainarchaeum sp.]MDD3976043.1 decarboxylase [Candidatus ainarchaeum sp.]